MNRKALLLVAGLAALGFPGCPGTGEGPADGTGNADVGDVVEAATVGDVVETTEVGDTFDPGPAGCLGGTPLAHLAGVPHDLGAGGFCQESTWVNPQDVVALPDGGWLVFGGVDLCCTDESRSALVHLDPAGALLGSRHWEFNGMGPQGDTVLSLWPFGAGGVLVVQTYGNSSQGWSANLSLEAVAPDLSETWHLSSQDLGTPVRVERVERPDSPDLHVLVTGPTSADGTVETTLLRITAAGKIAERRILPSPLPTRGPLPDTGRWWAAGTEQTSDEYEVSVRFVAVEVGWDGVVGPKVEVGPFVWNNLAHGWVTVWPLDPVPEGFLVWAAIPGPKPDQTIQYQAWRVPLDGRAPWQVPNAVAAPVGVTFENPARATVRQDGAVVVVANVADAQYHWRPTRVVFPTTGGAPILEGPAFDDAFAAGREWRLDGIWDLANGSLLQSEVLKADAVKLDPGSWPADGVDTVFVRLGADGAVRWTRGYGGGVFQSPPKARLWSVAIPGTATPWVCAMNNPRVPPDLLFFDGVCD